MEPLRVGVIGLGIGTAHLVAYSKLTDVQIIAVADLRQEVAQREAVRFGAKAYADAHQMIAKEKLDAVSICTPPSSHRELTEAAAAAGVHVLCEKPMASNLADCDAMITACRHAGVTLMIAQKKRFLGIIQKMKRMTESELGPIRWAVAKYALGKVPKDWFWQEDDGGGPLVENSVHTVDLLRYLMGEVKTVYAEGGNLFNPDRAPQLDVAVATLRFHNGAIAAVGLGQASEWGFANEYFFFACDKGEARISGPFDQPQHWWMCRRETLDSPEEETLPAESGFEAEIAHFLHCVRSGEEPLVTGEDARGSVAVCLAIKESARTGKPITLSSSGTVTP